MSTASTTTQPGVLPKSKKKKLAPVPAREVQPILLDEIDQKASYLAVLQIGAAASWRRYSGGKWELQGRDGDRDVYHHVPAMHETESISGSTLLGLAAGHNRWLGFNTEKKEPEGAVQRQVLVVDFQQTDELAVDGMARPGSTQFAVEMQAAAIKDAVTSSMEAFASLIPVILDEYDKRKK